MRSSTKLNANKYDVVIAGCGPAGSTTAFTIAKKSSLKVLMVDKKKSVTHPKPCGGGIAKLWVDKLHLNLPEKCIAAEIKNVNIHCQEESFHLRLDQPAGYILHRGRFDAWLLERAHREGVDFKLNTNIRRMIFPKGLRYIVAADGATSPIADSLLIPKPIKQDMHLCMQKVVELNGIRDDGLHLFFGTDFAPQGYAWCFPLGNGSARVGLGVPLSIGHVQHYYGKFIKLHPELEGKIERVEVAMVPTSKPLKPCVYGNIVFVGDAARHSDPFHGGGIANAMIAGTLAGEAIAQGDLTLYEKNIDRTVNRRNKFRYQLKTILYKLSDKKISHLLHLAQGFKPQTIDVNKEIPMFFRWIFLRSPLTFIKVFWRLLLP